MVGMNRIIFRWASNVSFRPFLIIIGPQIVHFSRVYFLIRGQRYENSRNIVSLRPINAQKFNIFVYNRQFSEEFV